MANQYNDDWDFTGSFTGDLNLTGQRPDPQVSAEEPTLLWAGQEELTGAESGLSKKPEEPMSKQTPQNQPKKKRRKRRFRIPGLLVAAVYLAAVIVASVTLARLGWDWANDVLALNKEYKTVSLELTSEHTLDDITDMLYENEMIEYPWLFKIFCKVTGAEEEFSFGSFELNTDMDYNALVNGMSSASATKKTTQVTIPEGYTVDQIFRLLVDNGVCETVEELQEVAANHDYAFDFLADIPLGDHHRLEGYLFPDTYEFYLGHDPKYAINKMLVNFDNRITDEMRARAQAMGYSLHDIVIVASLIERECGATGQKDVASVIYNRLNSNVTNGMLQFDSTVQYARELAGLERKEDLLYADLEIESDYNTYLHAGLPAGPIACPGLVSFQAALNPNSTNYYYFIQDADGESHFYKTYDEFLVGKQTILGGDGE